MGPLSGASQHGSLKAASSQTLLGVIAVPPVHIHCGFISIIYPRSQTHCVIPADRLLSVSLVLGMTGVSGHTGLNEEYF